MNRESTRVSHTEQANKTALVQANVSGKIRFDNENHRYLYPKQRLCAHTCGTVRKEKCRGGKQSTYASGTEHGAPAYSQRGPGRQHGAEADGVYINTYQFSLCICRLSSAGTEQLYVSSDHLLTPLHSPPWLQPGPRSGHWVF